MFFICGVSTDRKSIFVIDSDDKVVEVVNMEQIAEYALQGITIYGVRVDTTVYSNIKASGQPISDALLTKCIKFDAPLLHGFNITQIDVQIESVIVGDWIHSYLLAVSYTSETGYRTAIGTYYNGVYELKLAASDASKRVVARLRQLPTKLDSVMGELYIDASEGRANRYNIDSYFRYYHEEHDFKFIFEKAKK